MSNHNSTQPPFSAATAIFISIVIAIGLLLLFDWLGQSQTRSPQIVTQLRSTATIAVDPATPTAYLPTNTPLPVTSTPISTPTPPNTATPTVTSPPSNTPTPTLTPTPTRDLARCNAAGCGPQAGAVPTLEYDLKLLLRFKPPERRDCPECPKNPRLSNDKLDELLQVSPARLNQLETVALSQEAYPIAPGMVYIVSDYVHHVVIDVTEPGLKLRNIVPAFSTEDARETVRITPSYCMGEESLLVMTADYHGLVGTNKTDDGRSIFFHLGRAALYQLDGEYDLDVIREDEVYDRTSIAWGGGPIFMWAGEYNYNPEQEWFSPENLDHYQNTKWSKLVVAISKDRRYVFLSASFDISLEEHTQNVINLGMQWGIDVDRAMRFDGSESAYMAIRMDDVLVPVLGLEEPLIVNCFTVERE